MRIGRLLSGTMGVVAMAMVCVPLLEIGKVTALPSGLMLAQIKVSSSGQYVTIFNASDSFLSPSDTYQLVYYNNFDRAKATSSKIFPILEIPGPKGYYIFNDGPMHLCHKATVDSVSLGFSTTSGMIELAKLDTASGTWVGQSSVKWTSKAEPSEGVQTMPAQVAGKNSFLSYDLEELKWKPAEAAITTPCLLQTIETTPYGGEVLPATATPAVKGVVKSEVAVNKNAGMVAPELTELFPNPGDPQSDDTDEFIELYNPNDATFDLTGYRIEVGTSFSRGHTFESGTIGPKAYEAFYIPDTKLQLSNSEGQARLVSPEATTISETPAYEDAPEGSSWSLVADSWQWTTTPTPAALNSPSAKDEDKEDTTGNGSAKKTSNGKVAGVSTTGGSGAEQLEDAAPLHPAILAGVGVCAVAYALYEYRRDMANRIFQLRRYLRSWRAARARL